MKILALEFSSARRGVAVVDGDRVLGLAEATGITPGPFELIESALRTAGVEREQIECIAVGLGPGSYTGVRSAIAVAQGWQLALGVKLLGLSSAEVLAATAHAAGITGHVMSVIDAQRREYYSACHEIDAHGWREAIALQLLPYVAIEKLPAGFELISPNADCPFPWTRHVLPSAAELGRLAARRIDFVPGEKLEPIYLRETTFAKAPPPKFY